MYDRIFGGFPAKILYIGTPYIYMVLANPTHKYVYTVWVCGSADVSCSNSVLGLQ